MHELLRPYAGEKAYWFVWADQWLSLMCSDIGLFILAGESIKVSLCCGQHERLLGLFMIMSHLL